MSLNPYPYFNGQREEAFTFYEKRLGGKITFMMRYEGSPMAGQAPDGYAKKVLHAGLAFGDGVWPKILIYMKSKDVAREDGVALTGA
jgi:PhnB protein